MAGDGEQFGGEKVIYFINHKVTFWNVGDTESYGDEDTISRYRNAARNTKK